MGKKDKAREVAHAHEFELATSLNVAEALQVIDAATAAAAPGGMKGSMTCTSKKSSDSAFATTWSYKGPGGVMQIMSFTLNGQSEGELLLVKLSIGEFRYQKGGMFAKPTLNGGKQIVRLRELLTAQLRDGTAA